jgi:rod shape-determining protein MreC
MLISIALLASGNIVQIPIASFLATTILRPFQVALTLGPRLSTLWLENRQLRTGLEVNAWDHARLRQVAAENHRLRDLLRMAQSEPESLLVTSILAREETRFGEVLHLDKGSAHGLQPGAPVASLARLVGMVDRVEPTRSRVLTVWNLKLRVSARVGLRGPGGILRWEPGLGQDLILENIPLEESLSTGDTVWTSGLGEVFPPGMLVGHVRSVAADSLNLVQTVRVRPFVFLSRLNDVLLIVPPVDSP